MKHLLLLSLVFAAPNAFAEPVNLEAKKSNLYYVELAPKEKIVFTLSADKICMDDKDKISVQEFESVGETSSTSKPGKVPVRIKNIFAESYSVCSNLPTGKLEKKITVGPFKNQMTHIRLVLSEGVQVTQDSN